MSHVSCDSSFFSVRDFCLLLRVMALHMIGTVDLLGQLLQMQTALWLSHDACRGLPVGLWPWGHVIGRFQLSPTTVIFVTGSGVKRHPCLSYAVRDQCLALSCGFLQFLLCRTIVQLIWWLAKSPWHSSRLGQSNRMVWPQFIRP